MTILDRTLSKDLKDVVTEDKREKATETVSQEVEVGDENSRGEKREAANNTRAAIALTGIVLAALGIMFLVMFFILIGMKENPLYSGITSIVRETTGAAFAAGASLITFAALDGIIYSNYFWLAKSERIRES